MVAVDESDVGRYAEDLNRGGSGARRWYGSKRESWRVGKVGMRIRVKLRALAILRNDHG